MFFEEFKGFPICVGYRRTSDISGYLLKYQFENSPGLSVTP
jgi:hypothetical protein